MRTNIELLMMLNKPGATRQLAAQDRDDLERDVMAQMQELSTLIGDLVDLAREDASEGIDEKVDIEEILDLSLERVRRRRPDVSFNVNTIPWEMNGDPFALGRSILNLLDNAAKWSPQGGEVSATMSEVEPGVMELSIRDSGPGIRVEDHERVFERFYRAPESRSMSGSGLGLAIVKQVAERHGGSVRVAESSPEGTDMRLTLPGKCQLAR